MMHVYVHCILCVQYLQRPEEGARFLKPGLVGSQELLDVGSSD